MNAFTITFENGDTISTNMNATLAEAQRYYIGQRFELYRDTDPTVKAVKVEQVCAHNNVDEYFEKCDDCGASVAEVGK